MSNVTTNKPLRAIFSLGIAVVLALGTIPFGVTEQAYAKTTVPTVENVKVSSVKASSAKVTWKKTTSKKVKGYQVKVYNNNKLSKTYKVKGRSSKSKTVSGLRANKSYKVTVRAYVKKRHKTVYGSASSVYFNTPKMTPKMLADIAVAEYKSGAKSGKYHKHGMKYKKALGYKSKTTWCSVFVSWCATKAGHPELNSCWVKHFSGKFADRYPNLMTRHKNNGYTPQVGDVCVWRPKGHAWDVLGGKRSHIGIVYKVDTKNKMIYTIEGNAKKHKGSKTKDRVFKRSYRYGNHDSYCPDLFITIADK